MYPFVAPRPLVLDSVHFGSILSAEVYWTDFTIYGFENIEIKEFRYHQKCSQIEIINVNKKFDFDQWPAARSTRINYYCENISSKRESHYEYEIAFTSITIGTDSNEWQRSYILRYVLCKFRILYYSSRIEKYKNCFLLKLNIENIEIVLIAKTNVEERNGKGYMNITNISSHSDASNFKIDFKYSNTATFMSEIVNPVVNTNWRTFKSIVEVSLNKFIADFIQQMVTPMFNEMALQDFIHMNESCQSFL